MNSIRSGVAALALAGAAAAFPSVAVGQTAGTLIITDTRVVNPADGGNTITIYGGQSVEFAYPSGTLPHNVDFLGMKPSSCVQTAGPDLGPVPPLPRVPSGPGWAGTCRFTIPQMYAFVSRGPRIIVGHVSVRPGSPPPAFPTAPMRAPFPGM